MQNPAAPLRRGLLHLLTTPPLHRAGFTFIEIILAVAIALLLVLLAVPSIRGVFRQAELRKKSEEFNRMVSTAQQRAMDERRAYAIIWRKEVVELVPIERTEEGSRGALMSLPRSDQADYGLSRPAALVKDPPPIWTFWRGGACEPAVVTYKGPEGTWTAEYAGLSARPHMLEESTK